MPLTTPAGLEMAHILPTADAVPAASASAPRLPAGPFAVAVDELVLARARRGDEEAVERLYRTFERPVYTLARRLCRTPQDAEDVLQETFLEVFRSLPRFRGDGSFAGWVRKVAASKALQKLRKQHAGGMETELDGEIPECLPSRAGDQSATAARLDLETALACLGDTARAVLWLHEVEGWSHDEIALAWGKSVSFSKSQLSRAHARLRAWLGGEGRAT